MNMLRPNTVTQCHNIGLWGWGWEGHPGNFPGNIQKLMPDGKWASHPTPQNSSFAMFLEEREGGVGGWNISQLHQSIWKPRSYYAAGITLRNLSAFSPKIETQRIFAILSWLKG